MEKFGPMQKILLIKLLNFQNFDRGTRNEFGQWKLSDASESNAKLAQSEDRSS